MVPRGRLTPQGLPTTYYICLIILLEISFYESNLFFKVLDFRHDYSDLDDSALSGNKGECPDAKDKLIEDTVNHSLARCKAW